MSARSLARILAGALLLALVLAFAAGGPPARAAGMSAYGTKNFTPAPATPSYFTGERGIPYAGPYERREVRPRYPMSPTAAAPARMRGDLYARSARPARAAVLRRRWTRPVLAHSRYYRSGAARTRLLRLARLRRLRVLRLERERAWRLRALRSARLRRERGWRR